MRDDVVDLIARYCEAVFRFDLEAFASCWAPDGVWVMPGERPALVGPDVCTELFAELRAEYPLCTQEVLSSVIELADRTATSRSVIREAQWLPDGPGRLVVGVYHDDAVQTASGWKFARRRFEPYYRGPTDLSGRVYNRSG